MISYFGNKMNIISIFVLCFSFLTSSCTLKKSGQFTTNYDVNTGKFDVYVSNAHSGDIIKCVTGLTLTSPLETKTSNADHFLSLYVDTNGNVGEQKMFKCMPGWSFIYAVGCINKTQGNRPLKWKSGWEYASGLCPEDSSKAKS